VFFVPSPPITWFQIIWKKLSRVYLNTKSCYSKVGVLDLGPLFVNSVFWLEENVKIIFYKIDLDDNKIIRMERCYNHIRRFVSNHETLVNYLKTLTLKRKNYVNKKSRLHIEYCEHKNNMC
jgi:hypothetical protein